LGIKEIVQFLISLPAMIKAVKGLVSWLEAEFGPNWFQRIQDIKAASEKWNSAQTEKERADAVSAMALAWNSTK
jgi:hypothetical protein